MAAPQTLRYGTNVLWPSPVKVVNLLEQGIMAPRLHDWLDAYADSPRVLSGPRGGLADQKRGYSRQDLSVFAQPEHAELEQAAALMLDQADQYAREAIEDPLPEHERQAFMWFLLHRPNVMDDAPNPHCHEASDVAFIYYLSVSGDGSGQLMLIDPRGCTDRGGRAFRRPGVWVKYAPRAGDLVLMPRYLVHYSTLNTDAHLRKLIAGVVAYNMPRHRIDKFSVKPAISEPIPGER